MSLPFWSGFDIDVEVRGLSAEKRNTEVGTLEFLAAHQDVLALMEVGDEDRRLVEGLDEGLDDRALVDTSLVDQPAVDICVGFFLQTWNVSEQILGSLDIVWDPGDWLGK